MSVNNMRELLAYSAAKKAERAAEWNAERLQDGYCRGLTDKDGIIQTKYEHRTII